MCNDTKRQYMLERDRDTGQYVDTYSAEEFLTVIHHLGLDASTQAIAEGVGCQYDTAYKNPPISKMPGVSQVAKLGAPDYGN